MLARLVDRSRVREALGKREVSHHGWPNAERECDGAAPESNRASVGLPRLTGFEDRLGHRAPAAPPAR